MPQSDVFIPMIIGGVFVLLGVGAMIWGRNEEKHYYDALTDRPDYREFFDKWPPRPQFGALKTGGWILMALGLILLIVGIAFWLWG